MQHKGTVRLETARLILRRFRLDDSGAAFQNWTSEKRVTEFLRWPAHDTVNTTKKIIQMWVDGYAPVSYTHLSSPSLWRSVPMCMSSVRVSPMKS